MKKIGDYAIGDLLFRKVPLDKMGKPSKSALGIIRGVLNRYHKNKKDFQHLNKVLYKNKTLYEIVSLNALPKIEKKSHSNKSLYSSEIIIQGHFMFTGSCDKNFIKLITKHLRGIAFLELKAKLIDQKKVPLVSIEEFRGKTYLKFTENIPLSYFNELVIINDTVVETAEIVSAPPIKRELTQEELLVIQQNKKEKKQRRLVSGLEKRRKANSNQVIDSQEQIRRRYEEMERLKVLRIEENEKNLKKKGIYLTHPNAFKRCENCANFNSGSKCSSYNLTVRENHLCRRFYSFKTLYGGGFSPR
jgi:hypothetical protein